MSRRRVPLLVATALGTGILLAACTQPAEAPAPTASAEPAPAPAPTTTPPAESTAPVAPVGTPQAVTSGLDAPWSVVFLNETALISERDSGRILELLADGSARELGIVPGVQHGGEGGLLGLAIDEQGRLYVYSTGADGNRIQRFAVTGAPGAYALGEATTLISQLPSARTHNGGRLAFGPDGMLYATVGDASQSNLAQDLESLAGKILRMTPDGAAPADNPFPGSLVYSFGHRNPQGLAWTADGTMFATEFGQNTWDELNVIAPGSNYGWPTVEGAAGQSGFTDPVQQWAPSAASPSGMTRIGGTLFIANLRGAVLRSVPVADPGTSTDYYAGEYGRIRAVTEAPDGALWFVTNNTDGQRTPGPEDDLIMSVGLE
ncbi:MULTISPECIES: sorbosone dehydrogenase family protein [unclassified Leucobacter]|uniref:PQQ-dependent sugar dehydrogenase n=1 Tax=unclassified Leucobacter TaxID=2621730 RepID=UPI00165DD156|nr:MULTISPECIES: PQQ-dependent sugar dehydrogenase [unclassified Leucobacter]MBC9928172.1 PQQ-dependent sugar dehydrogenase [Leucobacter sp. cx-169]